VETYAVNAPAVFTQTVLASDTLNLALPASLDSDVGIKIERLSGGSFYEVSCRSCSRLRSRICHPAWRAAAATQRARRERPARARRVSTCRTEILGVGYNARYAGLRMTEL